MVNVRRPRAPMSEQTASASSWLVWYIITTSQPALASLSAMARPMPRAPPVTSAVLLASGSFIGFASEDLAFELKIRDLCAFLYALGLVFQSSSEIGLPFGRRSRGTPDREPVRGAALHPGL